MGRTVLGMHHVGRRLNIVTGRCGDGVIMFGIRRHRKTMMSSAIYRSIVGLIRGKLAGMIDGMLRLIWLGVMRGSGAQRPWGREVVIFIRRAR